MMDKIFYLGKNQIPIDLIARVVKLPSNFDTSQLRSDEPLNNPSSYTNLFDNVLGVQPNPNILPSIKTSSKLGVNIPPNPHTSYTSTNPTTSTLPPTTSINVNFIHKNSSVSQPPKK